MWPSLLALRRSVGVSSSAISLCVLGGGGGGGGGITYPFLSFTNWQEKMVPEIMAALAPPITSYVKVPKLGGGAMPPNLKIGGRERVAPMIPASYARNSRYFSMIRRIKLHL